MIRVQVQAPYQVCLNGTVFRPGETVEAPNDVARQWLASGWVEPANDDVAVRRGRAVPGHRRKRA